MRTLKKGVTGEDIKSVQEFLKDESFYFGKIDGNFGPVTENAVIQFQKKHGLKPDGIIATKTYAVFDQLDFKKDGTELDYSKVTRGDLSAIIAANSTKLVAGVNPYNDKSTSFDPEKHVIAVAIRGFDLDEGISGQNDRRIYDDKHFIITPNEIKTFDANTDPNGYRKGSGTGSNKGMACLKKGVWFFGKGSHKGSPAFRQCCPFVVTRDGNPPYDHSGYHAINWHSGGVSSTSSLGCQTNRPNDFVTLRNYIYEQMEKCDNPFMFNDWAQKVRAIPYILIEEVDRRKGVISV